MANKTMDYEAFNSNAQIIQNASTALSDALDAAAASMNSTLSNSTGQMVNAKEAEFAQIKAEINSRISTLNTLLTNTRRAATETNEYEVRHSGISQGQ